MNYYVKALKNYANIQGRASIREYWMFTFVNTLVFVALVFIGNATGFPLIAFVYFMVCLLPALAVGVRRMHDVGKSGWYILIPFYNFILTLKKGQQWINKYGVNPLAPIPSFDFEHQLAE